MIDCALVHVLTYGIVAALYAGRVLQALSGSAAWIVCLAILTENAGEGNVGKMMGISMSFVMIGTVGGPIIAGTVLELQGYWAAWSIPLVALAVNIIARLVMIDPVQQASPHECSQPEATASTACNGAGVAINNTETSPLLSSDADSKAHPDQASSSARFYSIMLRDLRIWASLATSIYYPVVLSGFNATLPVHLREVFDWGSLELGMVLFLLQIPSIFLGPLSGWLRDHVGLRYPTALGWAAQAPLILLLGIPGDPHFPWASAEHHGKPLFISCMAGIGIALPLIQGAGFLHTLCKLVSTSSSKTPECLQRPEISGLTGYRIKATKYLRPTRWTRKSFCHELRGNQYRVDDRAIDHRILVANHRILLHECDIG
jgi:MFS family permease